MRPRDGVGKPLSHGSDPASPPTRVAGLELEDSVHRGHHGKGDAGPPGAQVRSLTQFHSGDFSQSRMGAKKCAFSTNAQSKFVSVVFWTVSWDLPA